MILLDRGRHRPGYAEAVAPHDKVVFPSLVVEAGPLVFLEAVASGAFPIGVYQGGVAANIDALSGRVPDDVLALMKLRQDPEHLIPDMVSNVVGALRLGRRHAARLRRIVAGRHDWSAVARTVRDTLRDLGA